MVCLNLIVFCFSRVVRKAIARVYIVMHQKQKENLRKFYRVRNFILYHFFPPPSPYLTLLYNLLLLSGQEMEAPGP